MTNILTQPTRADQRTVNALLLPPHNEEAEQAFLGSLLVDPDAMPNVTHLVKPEMFYFLKHGWIYEAMAALASRRESIDLLTVESELRKVSTGARSETRTRSDEAGGESYLALLANSVPTALNVMTYAKLVRDCAKRREMIRVASNVAKMAYDQSGPVDEALDSAERMMLDVGHDRDQSAMQSSRTVVNTLLENVQAAHDSGGKIGIPSGYPDIDKLTGGMCKGDLILVAARPGMGKTAYMLNLAYNAAHIYGKRVGVFSLEMDSPQLMHRIIAGESGIDSMRLRQGDLRDDEWANLSHISMQVSDAPMFFDDSPGLTPSELRVKALRIYQEHGLDMIVVDYLQLMTSGGSEDNRVQELSYISRSLKNLARELKIPVIAGSQLSRQVEQRNDKRPMLSDLRDSGALEQDADIVQFIYRDEYYTPDTDQKNIAEINISKNRNGPQGKANLFFDKRLTSFKNLAREKIVL